MPSGPVTAMPPTTTVEDPPQAPVNPLRPSLDALDSVWVFSESQRTGNFMQQRLLATGVSNMVLFSSDALMKDIGTILTKLNKDRPSLVWISSLQRDNNRSLDERLQVAAKLIASTQHSLQGHAVVEQVNEHSSGRGIYVDDDWLSVHSRFTPSAV